MFWGLNSHCVEKVLRLFEPLPMSLFKTHCVSFLFGVGKEYALCPHKFGIPRYCSLENDVGLILCPSIKPNLRAYRLCELVRAMATQSHESAAVVIYSTHCVGYTPNLTVFSRSVRSTVVLYLSCLGLRNQRKEEIRA